MSLYRNDDVRRARQIESGLHPLPCPADAPDMSNAAFDGDRPASENCEEETCPEGCACPTCGENRIDYLVWVGPDYEEVECATCGTIYDPDTGDVVSAPAPPPEIVGFWPGEDDLPAETVAFERMGERYEAGDAPGYKEA